jgi:hypothetical protein
VLSKNLIVHHEVVQEIGSGFDTGSHQMISRSGIDLPDGRGILFAGINISEFGGSRIPLQTIEAYLATEYTIWGNWHLILRVGERNDELASLFQKCLVFSAAVLTAWNPYSELRSDAENQAAQVELISEIDRLGLRHEPGHGVDPSGKWPPEASRFVLGLDLDTAASFGHQFGQNGIVWVSANAVPTLVLLR